MAEYTRVECAGCGYSRRVQIVEGEPIALVIEASGWTPGEPDGDRETWICETCAKQ